MNAGNTRHSQQKTPCSKVAFKSFVPILGNILLFLGIVVATQYAVKWIMEAFGGKDAFGNSKIAIALIIHWSMVAALIGVIFLVRKKPISASFDFRKIKRFQFINTVFMGFVFTFLIGVWIAFTRLDKIFPSHEEMLQPLFKAPLPLLILSVGLIVPIMEECVFRGLIFNELRKKLSVPAAIIIQALLFGLIHVNPLQIIYAFCLGLLAAWLYVSYRSLWAPVLLHMGHNMTNIALSKTYGADDTLTDHPLPDLPPAEYIVPLIIFTAAFLASIYVVKRTRV